MILLQPRVRLESALVVPPCRRVHLRLDLPGFGGPALAFAVDASQSVAGRLYHDLGLVGAAEAGAHAADVDGPQSILHDAERLLVESR